MLDQRCGHLALEAPAHGQRQRPQDGLAQELVAEAQAVAGLRQHVGADRFVDRLEQLRRPAVQDRREFLGGEALPEHRRDPHDLAGVVAEPVEPVAHRLGEAGGKLAAANVGALVDDRHAALFAQALQELDEQERIAAGGGGESQQRRLAGSVEPVGHDRRDRVVGQRPEHHPASVPETLQQLPQLGARLTGAQREDPPDRQSRSARDQSAQGDERARVGEVEVVERHQERALERRALEHFLQLLDDPVGEVGLAAQVVESLRAPDGVAALEQRGQQRREGNGPLPLEGLRGGDTDPGTPSDLLGLGEHAGLADAGRAFEQQHAARRPDELADEFQLRIASSDPPFHITR